MIMQQELMIQTLIDSEEEALEKLDDVNRHSKKLETENQKLSEQLKKLYQLLEN